MGFWWGLKMRRLVIICILSIFAILQPTSVHAAFYEVDASIGGNTQSCRIASAALASTIILHQSTRFTPELPSISVLSGSGH
jgi:hypothetical protein